jgi:hypothetical protein
MARKEQDLTACQILFVSRSAAKHCDWCVLAATARKAA